MPRPALGTRDAPVFEDACSRQLLADLQRLASGDDFVLLQGEAGTGKRLLARQLHRLSARLSGQFWAVNCGAFGATQLEQDMLGHEKGAFRGAFTAKAGWFELAQHGTLFLDDITAMPLPLQARLLEVLRTGQVTRLGARMEASVDVRLVAAVSDDPARAVSEGRLLEGLHQRLSGALLSLPTLRQRKGDILPLAQHFIAHYQRRMHYPEVLLDEKACARLLAYHWPGNIRELENVIHHAMLVCDGGVVRGEDLQLPPAGGQLGVDAGAASRQDDLLSELDDLLARLCETQPGQLFSQVESALVRAAYARAGQNQIKAAQLLGVSRNVLRGRLIEYGEISALK
jgi:DNA-binding NtrC family response regulator